MGTRIKLAIRSSDYRKFMRALNDYIMSGYRIKKIVIIRKWLFWYKYIAILRRDILPMPTVGINVGPIRNRIEEL